jgi:XTP/dITP diphosphohydrolase
LNEILIASQNRGKISEIREILSVPHLRLLDLIQVNFRGSIIENGQTFRENALIKAEVVFGRYGIPVIADDSGLCVQYLDGRPGVFSARYAGPGATDEENNALLLRELRGVPRENRKACFICAAVLYRGADSCTFTEGRVDGFIAEAPLGTGGFGYDPLFFLPAYGKTMAQLDKNEKNRISHRAVAFRGLKSYLQ